MNRTTAISKTLMLSLLISSLLMLTNCRSKQTKPEDSAATSTTQDDTAVDSTPMSFDPAGSDSGKIEGLQTVHFGFDKSTLNSEARKTIQANVDWMKANAGTKVQIEGHCDNRGSIEYNVALGERRANAVKDYMISLGVAPSRLSTISYGEEKPLESGDNEAAWAQNRRANFVPSAL